MGALSSTASANTTLGKWRDFMSLAKPRVTSLVLFTSLGGMWLAPGRPTLTKVFWMLGASGLGVAAANALNCWWERDVDLLMERTRLRPLPDKRIDPNHALIFGCVLGAAALVLAFSLNLATGLLGTLALLSYVMFYTPLKQISPKALIVGAVSGALPPPIGWTAQTGSLDLPALVLFGILFFWQLPHFLAIAMFRSREYARAGVKVLPVVRGFTVARQHALFYTLLLVPCTLALEPLGVAGRAYTWTAGIGGALFVGLVLIGRWSQDSIRWARTVFTYSLFYLTALFIALGLTAQ